MNNVKDPTSTPEDHASIFAVEYTYDSAQAEGRNERRQDHRAWLGGLVDRGFVLSTGPYAEGSGALILVRAESADAVRRVFSGDPFAVNGLIEAVRVTEWTPVMGTFS